MNKFTNKRKKSDMMVISYQELNGFRERYSVCMCVLIVVRC